MPTKNGVLHAVQGAYNGVGFSKGYNAALFTISIGALLGFSLAKLEYLSFNDVFCSTSNTGVLSHAAPGECYWYRKYQRNYVGIMLHLATILPASILVCFQFVPIIRHKFILYHRSAGYIILLLVLVSDAGVLMMVNHAFGGDNAARFLMGALLIAFTTALGLAYYNIKRLQIDQHRAWMIRAWGWAASIITLRIIMIIATQIQAKWGGEATTFASFSCDELLSMMNENATSLYQTYPACRPENLATFAPHGRVIIQADFGAHTQPATAAALDTFFGPAGWLAWLIHILIIELYFHLTPAETQRLRLVSYERQLKAGFKNPGSAGLTADRYGDSERWTPPTSKTISPIEPHASV